MWGDLRPQRHERGCGLCVLILVLVEDVGGRMQVARNRNRIRGGLNPCFGGRCGGTMVTLNNLNNFAVVLILVLVEDVGGH